MKNFKLTTKDCAILITLFTIFTFICFSFTIPATDYCDGWEDGYCEGWKDVKGQFSICPIAPICPVAKADCSKSYKCGYNRGFKTGMKAARE